MTRLQSTKIVALAGHSRTTRIAKTTIPSGRAVAGTEPVAWSTIPGRYITTAEVVGKVRRSTLERKNTRAQSAADEWGLIPSLAEQVAAAEQNLQLQVEQHRAALAGALSRQGVADLVGVSPQAVSDMAADGRLVGLKHGREWRFPLWQFTPDAAEPVLPALGRLAATFPGGVVSLARWMIAPNPNFAGQTPAHVMGADPEQVIAAAGALTAAGW